MKTVNDLLKHKGTAVWSVAAGDTVLDALKLMAEKNVGATVVLRGDNLVGILSERDYARGVVLRGRASRDTPVEEIMNTKVVCVAPEQSIEECMTLMTEKHLRHLPVLDGDRLAGMISIGDVVRAVVSNQDHKIKTLENYITVQDRRVRY